MRIALIVFLLFGIRVHAAMVRVIAVADARTLVIDDNGRQQRIRLGGIAITDETQATELLRWTAGDKWVFMEKLPDGEHLVWRSPDALFLNREVVLRGFARATQAGVEAESNLRVTYLGIVDPPGPQRLTAAEADRVTGRAAPRTRGGTRTRSSGSPSGRARAPRSTPRKSSSQTP
jgi:hypothetical protein